MTHAVPRLEVFPMVLGCGRSGTSLLHAMLDSHSELAMSPETNWVEADCRWRRIWQHRGGFDFHAVGPMLTRSDVKWAAWGFDLELVQDHMAAVRPATYPDYVRALYALFAERAGKPRYGDKSPRASLHLSVLATMFPEARFVHIIRDGRDVARSFLAASFGPSTAVSCADVWQRHVVAARRDGRRLGDGRYLEVFYDDLVQRPEDVLRRICKHVDLTFEQSMLDYHLDADRYAWRPEHDNLRQPPNPDLPHSPLRERDRERFEAVAGRHLQSFGFPLSGRVAWPVRIGARGAFVRDRCRAAYRSVRRQLWTKRWIWRHRRGQTTER